LTWAGVGEQGGKDTERKGRAPEAPRLNRGEKEEGEKGESELFRRKKEKKIGKRKEKGVSVLLIAGPSRVKRSG